MFSNDKKLLNAYFTALIKNPDFQTNQNNPIRILLKYLKCRGKLDSFLISIAKEEIENTKKETQLMRGNTIFTKLYNEYTKLYCNEYLSTIISPIIDKIMKIMNRYNITDLQNEHVDEILKSSLIEFGEKIEQTPLPSSLALLLKEIYDFVCEKRNQKEAKNLLETLFFLRFVFPPFLTHQNILKRLQVLVRDAFPMHFNYLNQSMNCSTKSINLNGNNNQQNTQTNNEMNDSYKQNFISSISKFYSKLIYCPIQHKLSFEGINEKEQKESYSSLVQLLKSKMKDLQFHYGEGFDPIFNILKGNKENTKINLRNSCDEMKDWLCEQENQLENANKSLKEAIELLKKSNHLLKKKIKRYQEYIDAKNDFQIKEKYNPLEAMKPFKMNESIDLKNLKSSLNGCENNFNDL